MDATPTLPGLAPSDLLAMADLARWAPSGDNLQPWRLDVRGEALEVSLDEGEAPAFLDFNLAASHIALGGFVEYLRLAAARLNYDAEVELLSAKPFARLRLRPVAKPGMAPLANALEKRSTNRKLYEAGSVSAEDVRAVREAAATEGVNLHFVTSKAQLAALSEAVATADAVRMGHRQCHVEFHAKVRWSQAAAVASGDGFFYRTFEIAPHEALMLRLTRSYEAFSVLKSIVPVPKIAASLARRQVRASGAVLMLQVPSSQTPLAKVGTAFVRAWLAAAERGLCAQPLAVLPLFLRRFALAPQSFNDRDASELERAKSLAAQVPDAPPMNETLIMLRLGRGPAASARTCRLPAPALFTDRRK